jgi:predicted nucleic acid-binding protein
VALILDTGPLLAAIDRSDRNHAACAGLLASTSEQLAIPAPILPELDFWMSESVGSEAFMALLQEINEGIFRVEELTPGDYGRVRELCHDYAQLRVGFVDAAVLAVTERLGEPKLATLDRRPFSVMRPRHVEELELLPDAAAA